MLDNCIEVRNTRIDSANAERASHNISGPKFKSESGSLTFQFVCGMIAITGTPKRSWICLESRMRVSILSNRSESAKPPKSPNISPISPNRTGDMLEGDMGNAARSTMLMSAESSPASTAASRNRASMLSYICRFDSYSSVNNSYRTMSSRCPYNSRTLVSSTLFACVSAAWAML